MGNSSSKQNANGEGDSVSLPVVLMSAVAAPLVGYLLYKFANQANKTITQQDDDEDDEEEEDTSSAKKSSQTTPASSSATKPASTTTSATAAPKSSASAAAVPKSLASPAQQQQVRKAAVKYDSDPNNWLTFELPAIGLAFEHPPQMLVRKLAQAPAFILGEPDDGSIIIVMEGKEYSYEAARSMVATSSPQEQTIILHEEELTSHGRQVFNFEFQHVSQKLTFWASIIPAEGRTIMFQQEVGAKVPIEVAKSIAASIRIAEAEGLVSKSSMTAYRVASASNEAYKISMNLPGCTFVVEPYDEEKSILFIESNGALKLQPLLHTYDSGNTLTEAKAQTVGSALAQALKSSTRGIKLYKHVGAPFSAEESASILDKVTTTRIEQLVSQYDSTPTLLPQTIPMPNNSLGRLIYYAKTVQERECQMAEMIFLHNSEAYIAQMYAHSEVSDSAFKRGLQCLSTISIEKVASVPTFKVPVQEEVETITTNAAAALEQENKTLQANPDDPIVEDDPENKQDTAVVAKAAESAPTAKVTKFIECPVHDSLEYVNQIDKISMVVPADLKFINEQPLIDEIVVQFIHSTTGQPTKGTEFTTTVLKTNSKTEFDDFDVFCKAASKDMDRAIELLAQRVGDKLSAKVREEKHTIAGLNALTIVFKNVSKSYTPSICFITFIKCDKHIFQIQSQCTENVFTPQVEQEIKNVYNSFRSL